MNKVQLLASMEGRETTHDWGAISIFGRARLNRLLEQQFVAGFDELSFLPSFSMEKIYLSADETEWITLDSLLLSKPLLSFETASLDNSQATLTLGIMSGTITTFTKPVGKPATLLSSFKVSEQQGYTLTMTVNLHMVVGEVDARGRVTLDLRNSLSFKCNLAEQLHAQNRIGEAFEGFLKGLPRHKRIFELGTLTLKGYNPLAPTTFYIRTQPAQGATDARSSNYGEGGVLIFIALRDKPSPGYFPGTGSDFPYYIPDDQDAQGNDLYSAALVLSHDMIEHVQQDRLDLLNSLLFPGENVFVESSRHIPKDLVVFGNIDPTLTSITIEPLFKVIRAGSQLQYTVRQAGRALKAANVQWSVRSLNSQHGAGSISATSGLYSSISPQQLGQQTVRNVVTARYTDPDSGQERRASALLAVTFEAVTLAPQASIHYMGSSSRTVDLFAVTLDGGNLGWTLLEPKLGSLTSNDAQATYTPPAQLPGDEAFAVQRIEVQDLKTGFKAEASVLLLAAFQTLTINPPHVSTLGRSAEVQLTIEGSYPPENLRWSVTSGSGEVSDTGVFTAPPQVDSATSVVSCEVVFSNIVVLSGYSVIQLSDFLQEPHWIRLKTFELEARNGQNVALGNGYQQIVVDVMTETEPVNGEDIAVTPEEISSLVIVALGGAALEYLPEGEQGFEDGAGYSWAVKRKPNEINNYGTGKTSESSARPRGEAIGAITRDTVYLHTRARDAATFHARFRDKFDEEYNSNKTSNDPPRTLLLVPRTVPEFSTDNYTFAPKRVAGGRRSSPDGPLQPEDWDYLLNTTDYWYLTYNGIPGQSPAASFVRCEFEGNQSTVQWESRRVNETMFSYTGYIFNEEGEEDGSDIMHYDTRLPVIMPGFSLKTSIEKNENVSEGQLLISLFRVDNVRYVIAGLLEESLTLRLLDKNGNRHGLKIAFPDMGNADSRQTLILTTFK